jgi:hypothetical protein
MAKAMGTLLAKEKAATIAGRGLHGLGLIRVWTVSGRTSPVDEGDLDLGYISCQRKNFLCHQNSTRGTDAMCTPRGGSMIPGTPGTMVTPRSP